MLVLLLTAVTCGLFYFHKPPPPAPPASIPLPMPSPESAEIKKLEQLMMAQLQTNPQKAPRTLAIPVPQESPAEDSPLLAEPSVAPISAEELARAEGRKKRAGLPMGVVLWDGAEVYASPNSQRLFEMKTGDVVRVFEDSTHEWLHVQPGLDVYLAATTKEIKPAGEHLPDHDGWVKASLLHVFEPEDAKEFLTDVTPVTLGNDPSFSTFSFYERAMRNTDPVIHRVIGPRFIALVQLHEDYSSSWSKLYRDADPKIRDAALAALRERGVANSRPLIEDLIVRLTELTRTKAQGETEQEVLSVLSVLKETHHPRVPAALASFQEEWAKTQNPRLNQELKEILQK